MGNGDLGKKEVAGDEWVAWEGRKRTFFDED